MQIRESGNNERNEKKGKEKKAKELHRAQRPFEDVRSDALI